MTKLLKKTMRKEIEKIVKNIPQNEIDRQSNIVFEKIKRSECIQSCRTIGIYVSSEGEIKTKSIIDYLFSLNKHVYIPQFKKGCERMKFLRLNNNCKWEEELSTTLWGIKQHGYDDDVIELNEPIDILLMPAVAYAYQDGGIARLGHGMGYFDRFIHEHNERYGRLPYLIGLSLNEQIVDRVPIEDHDVILHSILVDNCNIDQ